MTSETIQFHRPYPKKVVCAFCPYCGSRVSRPNNMKLYDCPDCGRRFSVSFRGRGY